jgi:hypothetical protein
MFKKVGMLTKLGDFSDAHAKAAHEHPCENGRPEFVYFNALPVFGERWNFVKDGRVVTTSHVKDVTQEADTVTFFRTSNSTYRLVKENP